MALLALWPKGPLWAHMGWACTGPGQAWPGYGPTRRASGPVLAHMGQACTGLARARPGLAHMAHIALEPLPDPIYPIVPWISALRHAGAQIMGSIRGLCRQFAH